jgi:metalloendopeptidase OMA1, mitochondrial
MKLLQSRLLLVLLAGPLCAGLIGCATVPMTDRRQLLLIPEGQEMQMGLATFEQMKQELPISKDPEANALVQRVGQRIAAVASPDLPGAQWEFVVFDSEDPNAFALPGGKVGVFAGILPITKDEAGLATVLGHEIAHAVARHGGERMSEALLMQTGGQILGATLSAADPLWQAAAGTAYGLGAQLGRALPHSRAQEAEADYIGLLYMARAGYNPEAALDFWTRFAEHTGPGATPWFLRTHPVTDDRIRDIQAALPEARAEYERSIVGQPR